MCFDLGAGCPEVSVLEAGFPKVFDRTLIGWVLSLFYFELVAPRFILRYGCPKVVMLTGVFSHKGSRGGIDDAARTSGCQTAI